MKPPKKARRRSLPRKVTMPMADATMFRELFQEMEAEGWELPTNVVFRPGRRFSWIDATFRFQKSETCVYTNTISLRIASPDHVKRWGK